MVTNEKDFIKMVSDFHHTFRHPVLKQPAIPEAKRCKLRVDLLAEELKELEEGIHKKDLVEIADALCDIQYVLCGAILEFGLHRCFSKLFEEVHRSNMSKACDSEEDAINTVNYYKNNKNIDCHVEKVEGEQKWLVYRSIDYKTIKSLNYSPANIVDRIK